MRAAIIALATAAVCLTAHPASSFAQTPPSSPPEASAGDQAAPKPPEIRPAQEIADWATVQPAIADFNKRGAMSMQDHIVEIKVVLDHAPDSYPAAVVQNGYLYLRSFDNDDLTALARANAPAVLKTLPPGEKVKAVGLPSPYMWAALLLGSYTNEVKRYDEAMGYLNRGLAIQPGNPILTNEKCASFLALHRYDDCINAIGPLIGSPTLSNMQRAGLMRKAGFIFVEMKRLDDAENAYNASLKLDPTNINAKNELGYIAKLRSGGQATEGGLITNRDLAARAAASGTGGPAPAP